MRKTVILTFDYEVFLGRNTGTIANCLIKPTNLILETLKANNAKAIFFVDAAWLIFLRKNFPNDFQLVSSQLRNIIALGSSVELHLHPHWRYAYKNGENIAVKSYRNYKLQSLNKKEINELFKESIALLENITRVKVCCFRAGGFCIAPFSKIKDAFEAFGIKYDFSVVPGLYLKEGKVYDFDFSKAPKFSFYNFQYDVTIPNRDGQFTEIPLSTYQNNPIYRLTNRLILGLKRDKIFGDGNGIHEKSFYFMRSIIRRMRISRAFLTIDNTSNIFFRFLITCHFSKSPLLVILSHPKTISSQAIGNLKYITNKYNTLNSSELDSINILRNG
jgi:hypothetical protein